MRVLLCLHQFLPDFFGGTESLALSVARSLQNRGVEVRVFAPNPAHHVSHEGLDLEVYEIDGIPVVRLLARDEDSSTAEAEYLNPRATRFFEDLVEQFRPDIVHFFHFFRLGIAVVDVVKARCIPAFYTPTDFWFMCPTISLVLPDGSSCEGPLPNATNCFKHLASEHATGVREAIVNAIPERVVDWAVPGPDRAGLLPRFLVPDNLLALGCRRIAISSRLRALKGIFSPTERMTALLREMGAEPSQIFPVPFGIDLKGIQTRIRPDGDRHEIVLGFIGTLTNLKGCHVLLEALGERPMTAFRVEIYGRESDDRSYFERILAKVKALHNVRLAGTFPSDEIWRVLAGIDALVVPSVWDENTPLVVLSALAAGCPVIGSDVSGINTIVKHDFNGLLFPRGDAVTLRRLLDRLLEESDLLARLRGNCERPPSSEQYVDTLVEQYALALNSEDKP